MIAVLLIMALPTEVPKGEEPLVDLAKLHDKFLFDIKYATTDNFARVKAYPIAKCALRKSVAERMVQAQAWLDEHHRGLRLMFKDCYRPDRVQHVLFNAVKHTKMRPYVANPKSRTGSIHAYGAAVDLTLADADGRELDMGTEYDHLGKLAEPRHEARFVRQGKLTATHIANRKILRRAMLEGASMKMIRNEWWHFNADTAKQVRKIYSRLDVPLSAID